MSKSQDRGAGPLASSHAVLACTIYIAIPSCMDRADVSSSLICTDSCVRVRFFFSNAYVYDWAAAAICLEEPGSG